LTRKWQSCKATGVKALKWIGITVIGLIACALERCRLVHGAYPDSLDSLTPGYLTTIPQDIIDGQPFHYRRTDDEKFLLYSVGWNERDDHGKVVLTEN
jgi:hypothetical protein